MHADLRSSWKIIVIYFVTATCFSLLFRIYQPLWLDFLKLPYGFGLNLLVGLGPLLAAVICRSVFKPVVLNPELSLFGSSVWRSIVFALAPVMVFIVIGIKNPDGFNIHTLGLKTGFLWLIYIYGEEYGWRGYLQGLVRGNSIVNAVIVGLCWYLWHLSFVFDQYNFLKELVFIAVLVVGSYLALVVTTRTKSLLTAVGLHFSFSVMTNIPFTPHYKYGVMAMVFCWALLLFSWQRQK